MSRLRPILLLLLGLLAAAVLASAGCGQKGDLYLPDDSEGRQAD